MLRGGIVVGMKLSILIVNYNGRAVLPGCLRSLNANVPTDYEVIVADNCSTDGSAEMVESDYPWVKLIRCATNGGFAAGNNVAAGAATGSALLLLNPDTELTESIAPALQVLSANPEIGVLTIRALERDGTEQPCVGRFPTPLGLAKLRTLFRHVGREHGVTFVDWVQGSFLLTSRENWQALGGLDERFFMYAEDLDFCKRTRDRGLSVAYVPTVSYVHLGGFNRFRFDDLMSGMARYVRKHEQGARRVAAAAVLVCGCCARLVRAVLHCAVVPSRDNRRFVRTAASACRRVMA
jgi:N-acetylglucosaminyl-diphospho-decaprenol L-rhamnosyltransferase